MTGCIFLRRAVLTSNFPHQIELDTILLGALSGGDGTVGQGNRSAHNNKVKV